MKRCSRIAGYSTLIGIGDIICSAEMIQRLAETSFKIMHPFILYSCHLLVKKFLRHLHIAHNHQHLNYLWYILHIKIVVFVLRATLCAIERRCFVCKKRKASKLHPIRSDILVERLGYHHRPFSNCAVQYFGPFFCDYSPQWWEKMGFSVHLRDYPCRKYRKCSVYGHQLLPHGDWKNIARRSTPSVV